MRTALLLGLLAPLAAAPETLDVHVESGTKITKTFTSTLLLELEDFSLEVNGEAQDDAAAPEVTIEDDEEIVFVDEYVTVDGGRARELVRTFESLEDSSSQTVVGPDGEEMVESSEGESELEGVSVRFAFDADDDEWTTSFADEDEDLDESLLEDLDHDADYAYLLPPADEVEELEAGDTWELDAIVFDRISSPSGDLKIDGEDADEETDGEFQEQFKDNIDGSIEATLERIEDGRAYISLEGEVSTTIAIDQELPEGAPENAEVSQELEFTFECEGELVWDLERGAAVSLEFGGSAALTIVNDQRVGEEFTVLITQEFAGTFESTASFE
ncbi:MAG: hypothetical protein VX460_04820 [Planctomycetota bacterium]|nr:hypothetical protein [Planctomycetota bacterium]